MVPPFIQGAERSDPPAHEPNSSAGWVIGDSKATEADVEPETFPEQDSGPPIMLASDVKPEYLLYYYPHSFYSQKVLMALFQKGVLFKTRLVNISIGEQFRDEFLSICPMAEVPALLNLKDNTIHTDSKQILDYLENEFSSKSKPRVRKLVPEEEQSLHAEFLRKLDCLQVDGLTLGSSYFGKSYKLEPQYPYKYASVRLQIQDIALQRVNVLRNEAKRVASALPEAAAWLNDKADEAQMEVPMMIDIRDFESIILLFENVLDECEAQLRHIWIDQNNPKHWLICPFITQADILLGLTLHRLWQLGFSKRIFSPIRPQLQIYYNRMKKVYSFTQSVPKEAGTNYWPIVFLAGGLLGLLVLDGVYNDWTYGGGGTSEVSNVNV